MIESLLKPFKTNYPKLRVGPNSDSGYVLIEEPLKNSSYLLSFGVGGNIDFEKEITNNYNLKCDCYDAEPYYDIFPELLEIEDGGYVDISEKIRYHKSHITKNNINIYIPKDIKYVLKMDIEGGEWDVFDFITDDNIKRMSMLIVELHLNNELYRNRNFDRIIKSLSRLNNTHRCIHIHGNNNEGYMSYTNNIPNVVECCYVLNEFSNNEVDYGIYPVIGLDFPCKMGVNDLNLSFWK
jgi:hypothetical protein